MWRLSFSVAHLDYAVGDAVEEVAVVGDEDDRSVEALQLGFEDLQRVYVEVVGRLVEDEAVRFSSMIRSSCSRVRSPPLRAVTGSLTCS